MFRLDACRDKQVLRALHHALGVRFVPLRHNNAHSKVGTVGQVRRLVFAEVGPAVAMRQREAAKPVALDAYVEFG